jgi:polysaccharide export outer membrane protein
MNRIAIYVSGLVFAVVFAVVLAGPFGCSSVPQDVLVELQEPLDMFTIGPEDILDVVVWRNPDLTREVVVRPDGMISLPLIGDVEAQGLTTNKLAEAIAQRLKEYKETPVVSVSVKQVNSYGIYVVGQVAKPAKYQLKSAVTVLQAIAIAGGFTDFASKNQLQVVRNRPNGDGALHEVRIPVRYADLVSGRGEPGNFILRSGDTLVVP